MQPLVTCIMPTYKREKYIPRAIKFFKQQDYPNKELIIIDDSPHQYKLPIDVPNIKYIYLPKKKSIGYKRNMAVKHGKGTIFINWDDDDYHGCQRISYQVKPIISKKAHLTVLINPIYFNEANKYFYKHLKKDDNELWEPNGWMCGTIACLKSIWKIKQFKNISLAEDHYFIMDAINNKAIVQPLHCRHNYVLNRHNSNTFKFYNYRQIKLNNIPLKIHNAMKI